jgi:transmembrane sensor
MRNGPLKPTREMIAEASAWLIEFRTDSPDQAQRDRFNAWLCTSPQHIQAYFEVAAAWSDLPEKDPEGRIDIQQMMRAARASGHANIVELGTRHASPPSAGAGRSGSARPFFNFSMKLTAVASLLFVLLAATGIYLYVQRGTYTTAIGEQRSFTLPDGSTVDLNALSKVRVRYTARERHIDLLSGQALFHVAKSVGRPFIVTTGPTRVRAVGTQFDIYRKRSGTLVTVVEGRVAVTTSNPSDRQAPGPSRRAVDANRIASASSEATGSTGGAADPGGPQILLTAGEQLAIGKRAAKKLDHPDIEAATAWTQKRLVFEDTPLSEVAEEFNRYTLRPLVIVDPALQQVGISGLYSSTDPATLIAFLSAQPGILVTETDERVLITRKLD